METIDRQLSRLLRAAIEELLGEPWTGDVPVEVSNRPELGDYASPVAFMLAKRLRQAPLEIAGRLAEALPTGDDGLVGQAVATPPAFLNLKLSDAFLGQLVERSHQLEGRIGDVSTPTGRKIVLEHTNINPNKAAHVGHYRNACLGDTVARMLRRCGEQVEVQNYIDDTGVQVADVVVGLRHLEVGEPGDQPFDQFCSDVYVQVQHAYDQDPELKARRAEVQAAIESGEGELAAFAHQTAARIAACNLATMARSDIGYDLLTWESDILGLGFWKVAFEQLRDGGVIRLEEDGPNAGCWVVPFGEGTVETEEGTVTEDKVLVTSRQTVTYTAKDIAYQLWKFGLLDRDFRYRPWGSQEDGSQLWTSTRDEGVSDAPAFADGDRVINVIDDRQSYPQQVVYESLRRLGYEDQAEASEHLAYAVVSLSVAAAQELGVEVASDARKVAMSGRGGVQVYADQLLDRLAANVARRDVGAATAEAVAVAAARYYMLKFGTTQEIVFDFEEALRTTGETGVYLQYAVVRATGIVRKLEAADGAAATGPAPPPPGGIPAPDRALLLTAADWPRVLRAASAERSPLAVAKYAFDLSAAFNTFYDNTAPVLAEEDPLLRRWRGGMVAGIRWILRDILDVLGVPVVDRL